MAGIDEEINSKNMKRAGRNGGRRGGFEKRWAGRKGCSRAVFSIFEDIKNIKASIKKAQYHYFPVINIESNPAYALIPDL
jgi:hypothetical protein